MISLNGIITIMKLSEFIFQAKIECPIYLEHLKQQTVHKEDSGFIKDEIIDVQPHPPFGTKAARKEAKERAAAR